MNHFIIQIFCLINYAPLYAPSIKFGQLVSPIKWDNPDFNTNVKVKIIPFFFLPQLLFLLFASDFWFFFFFFSLFSMWLSLTRTLLSFASCRSFSFLFGLSSIVSLCSYLSPKVLLSTTTEIPFVLQV